MRLDDCLIILEVMYTGGFLIGKRPRTIIEILFYANHIKYVIRNENLRRELNFYKKAIVDFGFFSK